MQAQLSVSPTAYQILISTNDVQNFVWLASTHSISSASYQPLTRLHSCPLACSQSPDRECVSTRHRWPPSHERPHLSWGLASATRLPAEGHGGMGAWSRGHEVWSERFKTARKYVQYGSSRADSHCLKLIASCACHAWSVLKTFQDPRAFTCGNFARYLGTGTRCHGKLSAEFSWRRSRGSSCSYLLHGSFASHLTTSTHLFAVCSGSLESPAQELDGKLSAL